MQDDTEAAARGAIPSPRQHFGEFVMYFLLTKFGLPSLRDAYLYSIVDAIARYSTSKRVELFAVMCGVKMSQQCVAGRKTRRRCAHAHSVCCRSYTSRISNVVLHLLRLMYPKFSAAIFRRRKYVACGARSWCCIRITLSCCTGRARCSWSCTRCWRR